MIISPIPLDQLDSQIPLQTINNYIPVLSSTLVNHDCHSLGQIKSKWISLLLILILHFFTENFTFTLTLSTTCMFMCTCVTNTHSKVTHTLTYKGFVIALIDCQVVSRSLTHSLQHNNLLHQHRCHQCESSRAQRLTYLLPAKLSAHTWQRGEKGNAIAFCMWLHDCVSKPMWLWVELIEFTRRSALRNVWIMNTHTKKEWAIKGECLMSVEHANMYVCLTYDLLAYSDL